MTILNLAGTNIEVSELPKILGDLDLYPILLRRHIERLNCLKFIPSQEQQVNYFKQFLSRERISDKDSLLNWLHLNNISESKLNSKLYVSLQVQLFKEHVFGPKVENLFLERKHDLDKVTYSLIRVRHRAKAVELHIRLQEEESTFSELASNFSEGLEQQVNGLIGPMELGSINPILAERLRISNPGQLWPPFEAEGWWVLIRHEKSIPAKLNDQMRITLIDEMYEQWIRTEVSSALDLLSQASSDSSISEPVGSSIDLPDRDNLSPSNTEPSSVDNKPGFFRSLLGFD